jgi:quinol monooxygenase YgiN
VSDRPFLIVEFHAAAGQEPALEEALQTLAAATRLEVGCAGYDLHVDEADPASFFFYEQWESAEALAAHDTSAHVQHFISICGPLLDAPVRLTRLRRI